MSRFHSYINSAVAILDSYDGSIPFAVFLKDFFRQHKKYGSRDRKIIGNACYCYFRLGKSLNDFAKDERLLIGLFLCTNHTDPLLDELKPGWNDHISKSLKEKIAFLNVPVDAVAIFPWTDELSTGIDFEEFSFSHLHQPDLFLRLRPGKEKIVMQQLSQQEVSFEQVAENAVALPNSTKLDDLVAWNRDAVVQDFNSQQVGSLLKMIELNNSLNVWDCCAASGGKSIMATDILGHIDLTVSDVRASIIANLKKRFAQAGIDNYRSLVVDLSVKEQKVPVGKFDLVIADVPCSGSGTWARTPEQLYYFQQEKITYYASLQKKILASVFNHVEPGGYFLYITCSVFKKENEDAVKFIEESSSLKLLHSELFKGYDKKSDTLFAALFSND